ncbi:hypothetical protein DERF_013180 [Dermatophagoides farinae]|uniref:UDP-glucuronosyltransferase n=1 Tax=Dermatophagoides farinae TaxID=6954 RepID=A0A922KUQ9_DERFA|nr:hypothetical protein DERF_013180 [Dermatophagoides farinae]
MANQHLKIFFMAVDGVGHINACIGLAQPLIKRGHEVIFLTNEFFSGTYEKFGFKEIVLKSAKVKQIMNKEGNQKAEEHPTKAMASVLKKFRDDGTLSGKPSIEKLQDFKPGGDNEFANLMYESVKEQNPQLITLIDEEKPDLIIMDQFIVPPCVAYGKIPWAFLCSACPRFLYDSDDIPPMCSGYPSNDRTGWDEFKAKMEKTNIEGMRYSQNLINKEFGYPEKNWTMQISYHCLIIIFEWMHFVVKSKKRLNYPEEFKTKIKPNDKLIYLSMGSIGSIDVDLMKKLVNELSKSSHKFIISMGPLNDQYELADNMWGQAFVPQTNVIPLVDLVITHGGNNTVTETFSFGKPMIVMPLFGDQYDNAQRILEKGFGSRIDPYNFNDGELNKMIDQIFANEQIQKRCQQAAERIAKANSKEKACEKIESIMAKLKLNVN